MISRTFLLSALIGFGVLFAVSTSAASVRKSALPNAPSGTLRMNSTAEGERHRQVDTRVRTCKETGLCAAGKQRLLLGSKSPKEVFSALLKGCRSKRWLSNNVVLECPEAVTIPGATTERVFALQDYFSVAQVLAAPLQLQGIKGAGVRVAVLDTGIDPTHPEIAGRLVQQVSFIDGSDTTDVYGHGTHVSGIVLGQGTSIFTDDNGDNRILGIAPQADLFIGKVCTDGGWCPEGSILSGIEWAVANGVKVINLSLGGGAFMTNCDSDTLAAKVNWASNQGVVVVAAAGNGAAQAPGVSTPGCASLAIAVGAVDRSDVRQSWSGNGPALDVMAPGLGILSSLPCAVAGTCPESGYGWWSGTSMATPHVAGLVALIRAENPSLTPAEVRTVLTQSSKDLGDAGWDESYGFGRVDASAAVARAHDFDGDGSSLPEDCDDRNPLVSPLKTEICGNSVDDNCNGQADENCAAPPPSSSSAPASSSAFSSVSSASVSSIASSSAISSSAAYSSSLSSAATSSASSLHSSSSSWKKEDQEEKDDDNDEEHNDDGNSENGRRDAECRTHWWDPLTPWARCPIETPPGWEHDRPIAAPPGQTRSKHNKD